jgi:hypothetical protein
METVDRFLHGVHSKGECGRNVDGYAAISAASQYADLHNLDNYSCSAGVSKRTHSRKRSVTSQDTMVYIVSKLMEFSPSFCTYLLLFSRETPLFGVLDAILSDMASKGHMIITVETLSRSFILSLRHKATKLSVCISTFEEIHDLLKNLIGTTGVIAMIYPIAVREWIDLLNSLKPSIWCLLASKFRAFVSEEGPRAHTQFIFPWSKPGTPIGYTIGTGTIREGSNRERFKFEGKANFYDSMISSVPLESSCADCVAMKHIAQTLSLTFGVSRQQSKRTLSEGSIVALKELSDLIKAMNE